MKNNLMMVVAALIATRVWAGVPVKWTVETSRADVQEITVYHGETLDLEVQFKSYGEVLQIDTNSIAATYWQTNGMDTAYWRTNNVTIATNGVMKSKFTAEMDVGAKTLRGFMGIAGDIYRASFVLRFKDAPGYTPTVVEWPYRTLDFAHVEVLNAPWAYWNSVTNAINVATNKVYEAATEYTEGLVSSSTNSIRTELKSYTDTKTAAVTNSIFDRVDTKGVHLWNGSGGGLVEESVIYTYGSSPRVKVGSTESLLTPDGSKFMTLTTSDARYAKKDEVVPVELNGYVRADITNITTTVVSNGCWVGIKGGSRIRSYANGTGYTIDTSKYSGSTAITVEDVTGMGLIYYVHPTSMTEVYYKMRCLVFESPNIWTIGTYAYEVFGAGSTIETWEGEETAETNVIDNVTKVLDIATNATPRIDLTFTNQFVIADATNISEVVLGERYYFGGDEHYISWTKNEDETINLDYSKAKVKPLYARLEDGCYYIEANESGSITHEYIEIVSADRKSAADSGAASVYVDANPVNWTGEDVGVKTSAVNRVSTILNIATNNAANKTYIDGATNVVWQTVNEWENYWTGDNVRLSVTNYYGNTSGEAPRLRIEESYVVTNGSGASQTVTNLWRTVWDENTRHTNYEARISEQINVSTQNVMIAAWAQTANQLAGKAPKAWGSVTSAGAAAPSGKVWMTEPNTVFAGGTEYAHVACGEGTIAVLTCNGAAVYTEGDEGTFRFTTDDGSYYFGFDIGSTYYIGCRTDGISTTTVGSANMVSLTYDLTSSTDPIIYHTTNLSVNATWTEVTATWEQNPPAGTKVCYINAGSAPCGYYKAAIEHTGQTEFRTNMQANLMGGVVATNESTNTMQPIEPYISTNSSGTAVIGWRVKQ